jgi:hypothetical protein
MRVMLDTMIFDKLDKDSQLVECLGKLVARD